MQWGKKYNICIQTIKERKYKVAEDSKVQLVYSTQFLILLQMYSKYLV